MYVLNCLSYWGSHRFKVGPAGEVVWGWVRKH